MSTLLLHGGSQEVSQEELVAVPTPVATKTWTPIPHVELLDAVRREITCSGLTVAKETLGISNARNGRLGDRFFGLLEIKSDQNMDYAIEIGVRNSHDFSIPAGLCVGSMVLICSNMAFSAEIVIARRHTRNLRRDLPRLITGAVAQLADLRRQQDRRFDAYQNTVIGDLQLHDLAIRSMDAGVIAASKLPRVLAEYRQPNHPEFEGRTVWSLFNAYTSVLKDYDLQDLPRRTQTLHGLCDMICHLS